MSFAAACSDSNSSTDSSPDAGLDAAAETATEQAPTITATTPVDGATSVVLNSGVTASFDLPMSGATLDATTFKLTANGVAVAGKVVYARSTATFYPATHLAPNASFTATITTGAKSSSGVALTTDHSWTFTTGTVVGAEPPVNLGTSSDFVILAKTGISTVPGSVITGDLGISPAAATYITGFSLAADASNIFSTTAQVTGKVYGADYTPPTPKKLTAAIGDMEIAFTEASARAPNVSELGAGNIGGMTILPGIYKWGTGLLIPTNITLSGSPADVWIFQIGQDLTITSDIKILLAGGAQPKNIFWQVSGLADLGTTAHLEGVLLSQTAITLHTSATVNGRLMAQTAVTLAGNTVTAPAL